MKRFLVPVLILVGVMFIGACGNEATRKQKQQRPGFNAPTTPADETPVDTRPTDPAPGDTAQTPPDHAADPATPPPPKVTNPEYAKPVPGKKGYVTSPYAPAAGYIDVSGYPPGTMLKDPYTGKSFLVP